MPTTPMPVPATDIRAHAASCGRLDCGHLARSTDLATRRAVLLYVAAGAGYEVDLDQEAETVGQVYALLSDVQHPRPTYVRAGSTFVRTTPNEVPLPDGHSITMTRERQEVFGLMWQGYSASEIAAATGRARETVRSHAGYLRRETGAHDATSALVALVLAGRLADA